MKTERKTICLVGCGAIGRVHASNFSGAVDLMFCSRSLESAEAFNRKFEGVGVFGKFARVLDAPEVDAVLIASPPEFHCDQIVASIEAGKAVLVEKPMCVSLEEVETVEAALERTGGTLMVAENYYYKPSLDKLKTLIGDGGIGEVHSLRVRKESTQVPAGWKVAYGALLEGGIHFVALVCDLFDAAPEMVAAEFPGKTTGEPERSSITRMMFPGNIQAELIYSWQTPSFTKGVFQHSRIVGSRGCIVFESNGIYVYVQAGRKTRLFFPGVKDLMGYGAMTRDFLRCLGKRTDRPYSDFQKAKRDLQVVFDAYRSL